MNSQEMLDLTHQMNAALKKGDIVINRKTLLTQDYHTTDGKIVCTSTRIGGGFTMGRTEYCINNRPVKLEDAYKITLDYLSSRKS